jgi:Vitamin K-dependent gamma-carboxylase
MSGGGIRGYVTDAWAAWNQFWFAPADPATLSMIRVLAGLMLFYTHLVWSFDLSAFFGPNGWLPPQLMHEIRQAAGGGLDAPPRLIWSYFDYIQSPAVLWAVHIAALLVFFLLTIGFFSRVMAVFAYVIAVSYANRVTPGVFYGLDRINCLLAMYLMLGPCGARYSFDRIWRLRRGAPIEAPPSAAANLAIRLLQLHMCIIYFFSALGKLQGQSWWSGDAVWISSAIQEYQYLLDMTWLARHPWLVNTLTHVTVAWELSYCALVWPRLTRPWVLFLAILVHGGIIFAYGMPTFGLVMLIGNLAFISPQTVRGWVDPVANRIGAMLGGGRRTGQGRAAVAA